MLNGGPANSGDCESRLDPGVRRILERSFGVDLSGIRLHSGPKTDAFLRARRIPAAAAGHRVFLSRERPAHSEPWLHLLAHEVAHAIQQAQGVADCSGAWEADAEIAARAVLSGTAFPDRCLEPPRAGNGASVLAAFNSWEHMLLGDLMTSDMTIVATQPQSPQWRAILTSYLDLMGLWINGRQGITAARMRIAAPYVAPVTLPNNLLATNGEINALADFIPNVAALDSIPADLTFGFLQTIRQEAYNHLLADLDPTHEHEVTFARSLTPYRSAIGWLDEAIEAAWIDRKTQSLGQDHYQGLLARNACHFAPFAWHRWLAAHKAARVLAGQSYEITDPARRAEKDALANKAWLMHSYADHFLQDCFAPGHLTNKTQVMQWFAEWLPAREYGTFYIPVQNWESIRLMTTSNQPGLRGASLYDYTVDALSNDPQTSEEQATLAARIAATGVRGYGTVDSVQAYHQYLQFLQSTVLQVSSKLVHDYFNTHGLIVATDTQMTPFMLFGDGELFRDGPQIAIVSDAVKKSQQTIADILASGYSTLQPLDILKMVPTTVRTTDGYQLSIKAWHDGGLQDQANAIFDGLGLISSVSNWVKLNAGKIFASMGVVSQDQLTAVQAPEGAAVPESTAAGPPPSLRLAWSTQLGAAYFATPYWDGQQLFAGAAGIAYELSPATGKIIQRSQLADTEPTDLSFATDDSNVYVGQGGYVIAADKKNFTTIKWQSPALSQRDTDGTDVHVTQTDDGDLYAATSDGYLYQLSHVNGQWLKYNYLQGYGLNDARLAVVDNILVVGISAQLLAFARSDLSNPIWRHDPMNSPVHYVDVIAVGTAVCVADGASYLLLDPLGIAGPTVIATGSDDLVGPVRQATDGTSVYRAGGGRLASYSLAGLYQTPGAPPAVALNWVVPLSLDGSIADSNSGTNVFVIEQSVFASVNGMVFHVNPADGTFYSATQVVSTAHEVRLSGDGERLYCGWSDGTDGWVTALALNTD